MSTFYELRKRTEADWPATVLERKKGQTPTRQPVEADPADVKEQALQVRAALESSGLDHGPISVHDKMHAMGLERAVKAVGASSRAPRS